MKAKAKTPQTDVELEFEPYQRRNTPNFIRYPSAPPSAERVESLKAVQPKFDAAFPPIKSANMDVLILSWEEMERQFLDLCAPWDQQTAYHLFQSVRRDAEFESPEKTARNLFVINNIRTSIDTPEPEWGTGENFPMP